MGHIVHEEGINNKLLQRLIDELVCDDTTDTFEISIGTPLPLSFDLSEQWVLDLPDNHNEPWRKQNRWGGVSQKKKRKLARRNK